MMPRLSQPERDRAIGMLQAGRDRQAVARLLGVHHSTVVRLEQRYNTTAAQDRANRLSQITGLKCQGHMWDSNTYILFHKIRAKTLKK